MRELPPGQYGVELLPGWVLEREVSSGFEAVGAAKLTSPNPVTISAVAGQVRRVGFGFEADGVPVDFRGSTGGDDEFYD